VRSISGFASLVFDDVKGLGSAGYADMSEQMAISH